MAKRHVVQRPRNGGKACPPMRQLYIKQTCNTRPCSTKKVSSEVEADREARVRKDEMRWMWTKFHEKVQIDCKVNAWSGWSACTVPCDGGVSRRYRRVVRVPLFEGKPCPELRQMRQCNIDPCSAEQRKRSGPQRRRCSQLNTSEAKADVARIAIWRNTSNSGRKQRLTRRS